MHNVLHLNTARFVALALVVSSVVRGQSSPSARRPVQQKTVQQAHPAPVTIGVSSFRQTVGTAETESLAIGISDSLANALKGFVNLAVAAPEVVSAASEKEGVDPSKSDEGAVRVSSQLGLMMVVVGSYQHVGNQLIVDARILNVQTGAALPGSSISASAKYPEDYSALLTQLASRVATALRLPAVPGQAQKLGAASMSSLSSDALRLYNQGLQRMGEGTQRSLEAAVGLFTECLSSLWQNPAVFCGGTMERSTRARSANWACGREF